MAMNATYAGRRYAPTAPYTVGREKVREFAAATAATQPVHHDLVAARAAGYVDLVAPPTFAVIIAQAAEAQLIEDPEAAIDFSRVVHADERFTHTRPLVAGDEITTVLHVDSITERAGLSMVTTRCELFGDDALTDHVATVRSTLAVRGPGA
ncbi:FAS1-like dehydratase domain-containing protein [Sanguibacter sp. A247]|uniref:FAS1-like dehydratase domain-containing protein n=1 Tax=unclassified Sanguibacter TaxID=2645534 RepID=UPI003FD83BF8